MYLRLYVVFVSEQRVSWMVRFPNALFQWWMLSMEQSLVFSKVLMIHLRILSNLCTLIQFNSKNFYLSPGGNSRHIVHIDASENKI